MPAPLPTNLLETQPANPAAYYLKGAEFGLEEQTAQARLAEFAQRTQLEQQQLGMEQQKLGMMAEENKMKHLEAQQSLAIEKSYRDMQLTAQKRQLDMAGQLMQQRTQAAARQGAAMMEWDQFNKILDATPGMDDAAKDSARRSKLFQLAPGMSEGHMAGLSQMLKPQAPLPQWVQPNKTTGSPGYLMAGGTPHFPPASTANTRETVEQKSADEGIAKAEAVIEEGEKILGTNPSSKIKDYWEKKIKEKKLFVNDQLHATGRMVRHMDVEGEQIPAAGAKPKAKVIEMWKEGEQRPAASAAPQAQESQPTYTGTEGPLSPFGGGDLSAFQPKAELPKTMKATPKEESKYPPAPENKEDRVPGKTYMTEQGPMLWYYDKSSKKYKWMMDFGVMLHMIPGLRYSGQPKVELGDI